MFEGLCSQVLQFLISLERSVKKIILNVIKHYRIPNHPCKRSPTVSLWAYQHPAGSGTYLLHRIFWRVTCTKYTENSKLKLGVGYKQMSMCKLGLHQCFTVMQGRLLHGNMGGSLFFYFSTLCSWGAGHTRENDTSTQETKICVRRFYTFCAFFCNFSSLFKPAMWLQCKYYVFGSICPFWTLFRLCLTEFSFVHSNVCCYISTMPFDSTLRVM